MQINNYKDPESKGQICTDFWPNKNTTQEDRIRFIKSNYEYLERAKKTGIKHFKVDGYYGYEEGIDSDKYIYWKNKFDKIINDITCENEYQRR